MRDSLYCDFFRSSPKHRLSIIFVTMRKQNRFSETVRFLSYFFGCVWVRRAILNFMAYQMTDFLLGFPIKIMNESSSMGFVCECV